MPSPPQAPTLAQHAIRVRVYYEDTDTGGVVYYANYLKFFERCRTELLRARGVAQDALLQTGVGFVVRRAEVEYHVGARLDDELLITAEIVRMGGASAWFVQRATRDDTLMASAKVQIACIDITRGRPIPMPDAIAAAFHFNVDE
ncbi:MAG TPA: tol-pal system-associated acyl-CoA thioesterase [Burkholderiaceae bacterium]|nr:tol-pal system-associated acyl-CoA thioesterase [Burkholderiaceae bacterium]